MVYIYPTFLPSIATYITMVHAPKVCFEVQDNYQKQTYRNRTFIYGANGRLGLHIPVHYSQKNRQKSSEIQIDNSSNWQTTHWKSIESAYKTSPFFEYYEDDFKPLFITPQHNLMNFNFECMLVVNQCLKLDLELFKTKEFIKNYKADDFRFLVNARKEIAFEHQPYIQVFESKHGFIPNLSILDLIFNEGPNSLNYLKSQAVIDYSK
jgi:hypothetical protein